VAPGGLVVGFGGAVVMALPALGGSSSAFGVTLIAAALVSYGIALNVARPLQQETAPSRSCGGRWAWRWS
jgi:drug/metabolite transporter (DMT)-like permease